MNTQDSGDNQIENYTCQAFREKLNSRTKQIRPNKVKVVQASSRNGSFGSKHTYRLDLNSVSCIL